MNRMQTSKGNDARLFRVRGCISSPPGKFSNYFRLARMYSVSGVRRLPRQGWTRRTGRSAGAARPSRPCPMPSIPKMCVKSFW